MPEIRNWKWSGLSFITSIGGETCRVLIAVFRLANDRKLTHEELVRAIRFMVASEYEATQMYMQLAESTATSWPREFSKT